MVMRHMTGHIPLTGNGAEIRDFSLTTTLSQKKQISRKTATIKTNLRTSGTFNKTEQIG